MHHPWRRFRSFVGWTLRWRSLPGDEVGTTDYATMTVTLDPELLQTERRCTIAHETEHIARGVVPDFYWPREEHAIDAIVARRLILLEALADGLVWALDVHELADELWVDVPTAKARLANLTPAEGLWLQERLDVTEAEIPETDLRRPELRLTSVAPRIETREP